MDLHGGTSQWELAIIGGEPTPNTPHYVAPNYAWWDYSENRPSPLYLPFAELTALIAAWLPYQYRNDDDLEMPDYESMQASTEKEEQRNLQNSRLLESLSDDALSDFVALYYVGRGDVGRHPTIAQWESLRREMSRKNRDVMIFDIVRKTPMPDHIAVAVDMLRLYRHG